MSRKPTLEQHEEEEILESQIEGLYHYLPIDMQQDDSLSKQRQGAREKLTKLSKQQFKELSTDVFDEMNRRVDCANKPVVEQVPFLQVREDFHPKRNQTRQKLATLPEGRYKDLASDVFFELCRRYPNQKAVVFEAIAHKKNAPPPSKIQLAVNAPIPPPISQQQQQQQLQQLQLQQQLQQPKLSPALPPPLTDSSNPPPTRSIAKKDPLAVTEIENEFASLNFESLDSLMADLGSMIVVGSKKEPAAPAPSSNPEKAAEPMPMPVVSEIYAPLEAPKLSTEQYIQSTRKSIFLSKELTDTLKKEHAEEIKTLKEYNTSKISQIEAEHKQVVSQYEKRIAELEAALREATSISQSAMKHEEEHKNLMTQNQKLQQDVANLELAGRQSEEKIRNLNAELRDEKENRKQFESKILNLEGENLELVEKINTMMEDLTNRLRLKDQELIAKVREFRELVDQKNTIEMDRNEIQVENIALKEECRTLKETLKTYEQQDQQAKSAPNRGNAYKNPTSVAMQVSITEEMVFNEGESMKDLTKGLEELLAASQESNPPQILMAMKAVVMTVRRHLDDAEEYEKTHKNSLTQDQKEKFNNLQNDISEKLTSLVMVAKVHASGKYEGPHSEVMGKMEGLSTGLSNVVVRLLGGMMNAPAAKAKEFEVDDLPGFLDKQTNIIVQSIQTLLLIIKNPSVATQDYIAAIDSLIAAVTLLKNVATHSLKKTHDPQSRERLDLLLRNLSEGITRFLNTREIISSGAPRPTNQVIAASAFDVAKNTKEIVTVLS